MIEIVFTKLPLLGLEYTPSITPDRWAGCGAGAGGARCRWSGARGGDTGSALIFTLLGDAAGGGVPPPPSTGKLLLWMELQHEKSGTLYLFTLE